MKHITFSDENMSISAEKCSESALKYGCDLSEIFIPDDIDTGFYEKNKEVLDADRGAGFWLWKPYFFYRELQKLNDNEILIYTDAGILFLQPIELLLNEFDGRLMLFGNRWPHKEWTKMDVLKGMGCEDFDSEQLQASCIIATKNEFTLQFFSDWLEWCQVPGYIDDSPSKEKNVPGFRDHRHDQSILTNLALLNGVKFNFWPCQYNVRHKHKYDNNYPVMFLHHRYRNDWWDEDELGLKKWIR